MLRSAVIGLASILLVASIGTASASTDARSFDYFVTPSTNILCQWWAPFEPEARPSLRCDIRSGLEPRPKRPRDCDTDWGLGMSMLSTGRATILCAGDTVFHGWRPVLNYGETWRKRGFTCRSRRIGLRCRNSAGHGFFLSRERWERF